MAEIVGVIACSIQLGNALLDLRRFFAAIRDAPKEVVSLLEDTARTNRVLQLVVEEQQQIVPFVVPKPEWAECHEACRATANELSDIVGRIHKEMNRHKLAASLKCMLRKDTITALRQRLDSAKSTLSLAEHTFNRALQIQNLQRTIDIQAILSKFNQYAAIANTVMDPPQEISDQEISTIGDVDPGKRPVRHHNPLKSSATLKGHFKFRTPSWLFNRIMEVRAYYCANPWEYTIRIYSIVPATAPIFEYTRQGDIENLKPLLKENPSLIALRTSREGLTPLHMAIRYGQVEAACFLISCGADPQEHTLPSPLTTCPASSCFDLLTRELIFETQNARRTMNILHLLIEENECDELIASFDPGLYLRKWLNHTSNLGEIQWYYCVQMIQRSIWPPYQSVSLHVRLKNAVAAISWQPDHFWEILGQKDFDEECIALARDANLEHNPCSGQINPLPILLANIADLLLLNDCHQIGQGCDDPSRVLEQCRDILRRYVSAGGDEILLLSASECLISFVQAFLNENATAGTLGCIWQYGTKMFAQELVEAGLEGLKLAAVGAEVRWSLLGTQFRQEIISAGFWCTRQTLTIRLVGIEYGATSSDWVIWIADDRDEHTGVFWQSVEGFWPSSSTEDEEEANDEHYSMPGAWIDHTDSLGPDCYGLGPGFWTQWYHYSSRYSDEVSRTLQVFSSSRRKRRRALRYFGLEAADYIHCTLHTPASTKGTVSNDMNEGQAHVKKDVETTSRKRKVAASSTSSLLSCPNNYYYSHAHFSAGAEASSREVSESQPSS